MVGHQVDHVAEAGFFEKEAQAGMGDGPAQVGAHPAGVRHVVAVGAAGGRLEGRGGVKVADAQAVQVGNDPGGFVEAKSRPELDPVRGGRFRIHGAAR